MDHSHQCQGLWGRIVEHLSIPERDEVYSIIGSSLIDSVHELHLEFITLEEILNDLKTKNDLAIGSRLSLRRKPLPDTVDRKLLEGRVKQLIAAIQANSKAEKVSDLDLGKDQRTFEYFTGTGSNNKKTERSYSATTKQPSLDDYAPPSTRSAPDVLENLEDKLNFLQIDDIIGPLRSAFEEEKEELLQDISMMQAVIEHENERGRRQSQSAEENSRPSQTEVKNLLGKLDEKLRQEELMEKLGTRKQKLPFEPSPIKKVKKGDAIHISPLRISKSRVVYSPSGDGDDDDVDESKNDDDGYYYAVEESKIEQQEKKSRTRSLLQKHVSNSKLEEGLGNDDLKFFM